LENDCYDVLAAMLDNDELIDISRENEDVEHLVSHALRALAWPEYPAAQALAVRYGFVSTELGNRFDLLGFDSVHEFYRMANFGKFDLDVLKALRTVLRPTWTSGEESTYLRDRLEEVDKIASHVADRYPALFTHWLSFSEHSEFIGHRYTEFLGETLSDDLDTRLEEVCRSSRGRITTWIWAPLSIIALFTLGGVAVFVFLILYVSLTVALSGYTLYPIRLHKKLVHVAADGGFGNALISDWAARHSSKRAIVGYTEMVKKDHGLELIAALHHRCGWSE
jgi:hypothetical protein